MGRKEKEIKEWKGKPLFGDLNYKGKMFVNFCCSFNLFCSSFNFYNFSQDCVCNFSIRHFSALILNQKNIEICL
jgi:hypothetical protein